MFDEKYTCNVCGKEYNEKSELSYHLKYEEYQGTKMIMDLIKEQLIALGEKNPYIDVGEVEPYE